MDNTSSDVIAGVNKVYNWVAPIDHPREDGITYLTRAAELLSEKEAIADIYFKIGNIYLWLNSQKKAYPFFERSIALMPDNANARQTLIDIYRLHIMNKAALEQLNYLYDSSQVNFEKRLLLAQFNIHAGQFENADELLNKAEFIYPLAVPEIADLRGRLNMLANNPEKAIVFYENYVKTGIKKSSTAYTLSRLYAKTGKNSEAFKWLETAIKNGFNHTFVLQYDPLMDNLRETAKWKTLVGSISKKEYRSNFKGN